MEAPTELTSQYPSTFQASCYAEATKELRLKLGKDVPIAITELGAYGTRERTGDCWNRTNALGMAEYALRCINAGVSGLLRWQFNAVHSGPEPCSQHVAFQLRNGRIAPSTGPYWGWATLMRWTTKGSQVLKTKVIGAEDSFGMCRVSATTLRAPAGFTTVLIVNTGCEPKSVTLHGLNKSTWNHYYFDTRNGNGLQKGNMTWLKQVCALSLQPESINVLTDCKIGLDGSAPR